MQGDGAILDLFGVDLAYLAQVVRANPSLRGYIIGYLAERKLWDRLASDPRVTAIRKDDDHDRENKGDLVVTYRGFDFRFEVKSLETNSVSMFNEESKKWVAKVLKVALPKPQGAKRGKHKWMECETYREVWVRGHEAARFKGKVQCDGSDKRQIQLPNGRAVTTTNLQVGEFDILAMGLFAFRERWEFGFMLNEDLPRTTFAGYDEQDRPYLLKTKIPVEWPLNAGVEPDPFTLLDRLIAGRQGKSPSSGTS